MFANIFALLQSRLLFSLSTTQTALHSHLDFVIGVVTVSEVATASGVAAVIEEEVHLLVAEGGRREVLTRHSFCSAWIKTGTEC